MAISADVLRTHLDYTGWASQRLVSAAAKLPQDDLTYDFKTADRSVLGTLVHIYAADRIWLARVSDLPTAAFTTDADYHLTVLENDWPTLHERWRQWALPLTDEAARAEIAYKDTRGNAYRQPLWQLILHVVNHGSHHRGQVSGFLRALGQTPPPLDLTAYYRQQASK
jgi:uncharacterized damage-inducible protein DinB